MRGRIFVLLTVFAFVFSLAALPAWVLATHVPAGPPDVQILAPLDGQEISSLGVRLQISVTNFTLDPADIGLANDPGHGHYHIYVNDTFTGTLTADPIVDISNFPVGPMKLGVELKNNDHTSLSPEIWHNISVEVVDPSVTIVLPPEGGMVSTEGARFQLDVPGFELDTENYGGNPIAGHGHYHVFVDGSFTGITPTVPSFDIPSFTPGDHTVFVDLRANNHAPLVPSVNHTINVTAVAPSITIATPADGATVSNQSAQFTVAIDGWELDGVNYGGNPIPGHGHYHVFVDGSFAGITPTEPTFAIPSLTVGDHTVFVDLRANNHAPLVPSVNHTINVTAVAPAIAIMSPADGGSVSTQGAQFTVAIDGLELDGENYGGTPIPGHGHYHVSVDGSFTGITPTEPIFAIPSFSAGDHTVLVDLRTNNHQLLSPTAEASITVTAVDPSISIVSPAANAMVSTMGLELEVAINGWELDGENYNGNPIPGHGHYHVFVDGAQAGTPTTPTFRIDSLTAGSHTITVDLRTNNHEILSPTVEASTSVTAAAPSISILEPADGATVGATVALRVDIGGFTIDPEAIGLANVAGRGHYHVTVDGTTIDFEVTGPVYAIEDLAEGGRTVEVSLHNNDHSALSPAVSDQVTITVAAAAPTPPAGVDSIVFIATTVSLLVVLVVVAVALYVWGRKGKEGT